MNKLMKKAILVGLGAGALTKKKVEKEVHKYIKKSGLSSQQGKRLISALVKTSKAQAKHAARMAEKELGRALRRTKITPAKHVRAVVSELAKLEKKLKKLQGAGKKRKTTRKKAKKRKPKRRKAKKRKVKRTRKRRRR